MSRYVISHNMSGSKWYLREDLSFTTDITGAKLWSFENLISGEIVHRDIIAIKNGSEGITLSDNNISLSTNYTNFMINLENGNPGDLVTGTVYFIVSGQENKGLKINNKVNPPILTIGDHSRDGLNNANLYRWYLTEEIRILPILNRKQIKKEKRNRKALNVIIISLFILFLCWLINSNWQN